MAILTGVVLSGALVLTASRAAFSANTSNSANQFTAGTVTLTDDDSDSAMFTVTNIAPNDPAEVRCIEVTYGGTITDPGEVRLYSGGLTDSGSLADELDITIEIGTGATTGLTDCSSFSASSAIFTTDTLSTFNSIHTAYATGITAWDPSSSPETRTFRFTVDLPSDAADVQGDSVTDLVFTWEVQS